LATKPSSCGWKVTVYVSVARESCSFLCAYGILGERKRRTTRSISVGNKEAIRPFVKIAGTRVLPALFADA
jgi:hypothetical protein